MATRMLSRACAKRDVIARTNRIEPVAQADLLDQHLDVVLLKLPQRHRHVVLLRRVHVVDDALRLVLGISRVKRLGVDELAPDLVVDEVGEAGGRGRPGASSAGQENVLDVRVRPKPGAEQSIIRLPEPSAHFPAHVHLDQRELLEILLVDLVEVGC